MDGEEGRLLLEQSGTVDHEPLMRWFEGQERLCFCSVASSVITLNALHAHEKHAQRRFLTPTIGTIRTQAQVDMDGMTLAELAAVLRARGAVVSLHEAEG